MHGTEEKNIRVSLELNSDIRYWTDKFNCTKAQLCKAVQKVGSCANAVRQEIMCRS